MTPATYPRMVIGPDVLSFESRSLLSWAEALGLNPSPSANAATVASIVFPMALLLAADTGWRREAISRRIKECGNFDTIHAFPLACLR